MDMTYANIILYSSVLPNYGGEEEKKKGINADDPKNRNWLKQLKGEI